MGSKSSPKKMNHHKIKGSPTFTTCANQRATHIWCEPMCHVSASQEKEIIWKLIRIEIKINFILFVKNQGRQNLMLIVNYID